MPQQWKLRMLQIKAIIRVPRQVFHLHEIPASHINPNCSRPSAFTTPTSAPSPARVRSTSSWRSSFTIMPFLSIWLSRTSYLISLKRYLQLITNKEYPAAFGWRQPALTSCIETWRRRWKIIWRVVMHWWRIWMDGKTRRSSNWRLSLRQVPLETSLISKLVLSYYVCNQITYFFFYVDDNNIGFFKAAIEANGEMQDAESYYRAIKPTVERENAIGLGTDDPPVMRSCRKKVIFHLYICPLWW